jgi:hypothetical protein
VIIDESVSSGKQNGSPRQGLSLAFVLLKNPNTL